VPAAAYAATRLLSVRVGLWAAVFLGVPLSVAPRSGLVVHGATRLHGRRHRPEPALWITLAATPANAGLAYALIFGAFGFSRLELFMSFGISLAATIRVGLAVGRRQPQGARRAGFAAIMLSAAFMAAMTLGVGLERERIIPLLFLGSGSEPRQQLLRQCCCSWVQASSSPTACRRWRPEPCAG
jgi:Na+-driven multidrug efflux pump